MGYNLNKNSWSIQGEKLDGRNYLPTNTYMGKINEDDEHEVEMIGYEMLGTGKGRTKYLLDSNGEKIPLPPKGPDADRPFLEVLKEMFEERMQDPAGFPGQMVHGARFVETEIGKNLKMGDICVNVDPKFTSTWDVVTYAMLMNHNVQVHLEGVYESQDLYDKGDPAAVPQQLLEIKSVVEDVFNSETPMSVIERNRKVLNYLASDNAERGVLDLQLFEVANQKDHVNLLKAKKEAEAPHLAENKPKMQIVNNGLFV